MADSAHKDRSEDEMVAYALEIDPALLEFVPELLADLDELGSDAAQIVEVLEDFGVGAATTVLDVGCGKGALATAVARQTKAQVLGIDLFAPFVAAATERAAELGVSEHCQFRCGNALNLTAADVSAEGDGVDVLVYAAMGDVLGRLDATVALLRQLLRPGGYLVISDCYVAADGSSEFPGFGQYARHAETIRRLTAAGDALVAEYLEDEDNDEALGDTAEEREVALIRARAVQLARAHPARSSELLAFVESQEAEVEYIGDNLVSAIWVLQKSPE